MRHIFRLFSPLLGICVLLFFAGCAPVTMPTDVLAYQKNAAAVSVSGNIGELDFAANVTLASCEELSERDFTVEYTAPAALRGVTVSRRAGVCEARLDTVRITGEAARRLARPAEAFALGGEISKISAEGAKTLVTLTSGEVAIANGEPRRISVHCEDGTMLTVNIEKYVKEGTKQ